MTFHELTPDDEGFRSLIDPEAPGHWIVEADGVITEGTVDEEALAEADDGRKHFTPPDSVDYEGYIDEEGKVRYKRADVLAAEKANGDPYAVVVPVPDALYMNGYMNGEVLPRELTDRGSKQDNKRSEKN